MPRSLDVIPTRSEEGQRLFERHKIRSDRRYLNWWYWDGMSLHASNQGGAALALRDVTGWEWVTKPIPMAVLNHLDNWVKKSRPFLSRFTPQGPAIKRRNGVQCTVVSF